MGDRCIWEDNIRMDLKEIDCESMDWIHLAQDKLVSSCERGNETTGFIKCGELFLITGEKLPFIFI